MARPLLSFELSDADDAWKYMVYAETQPEGMVGREGTQLAQSDRHLGALPTPIGHRCHR